VRAPRRRVRFRFADGEEVKAKEPLSRDRRLQVEEYLEERRNRRATPGEIETALARVALLPAEVRAVLEETPATACVLRVMRAVAPRRLRRLDVAELLSHGLAGASGRPRKRLPVLRFLADDVRRALAQTVGFHLRAGARLGVTRSDALAALRWLWPSRRGRPPATPGALLPLVVAHYDLTLAEQRRLHPSRRGSRDLSRIGEESPHERALRATAERLNVGRAAVRAALRRRHP
jgi:hypothetical protein